MLPEGDEIAAHAERDEELQRDPPPADQLATNEKLIPHPQPWSVHNASMLRECLLAMGFSQEDAPAKLQVRNFLNRILCQQRINKNAVCSWPILCAHVVRCHSLWTLWLCASFVISIRSSGPQTKSAVRVLHSGSVNLQHVPAGLRHEAWINCVAARALRGSSQFFLLFFLSFFFVQFSTSRF